MVSEIRSGWYGERFSPGSFEICFHVQIKRLGKSEEIVVFFLCREDHKGTDGTEIYIVNKLENKGTQVRLERCIPHVLVVIVTFACG